MRGTSQQLTSLRSRALEYGPGQCDLIGVTRGIATGKSTVDRMLEAHGATVVDADQLAREVVSPR